MLNFHSFAKQYFYVYSLSIQNFEQFCKNGEFKDKLKPIETLEKKTEQKPLV